MPAALQCPICRKPVDSGHPDYPFCSDRCRLIDLGKWASGEYRISTPILDPEELPDGVTRQSRNDEDEA